MSAKSEHKKVLDYVSDIAEASAVPKEQHLNALKLSGFILEVEENGKTFFKFSEGGKAWIEAMTFTMNTAERFKEKSW